MLTPLLVAALAVGTQWAAGGGAAPAPPTFARDIAPILYRACTTCHRPGQPAPFPLISYTDARQRAQLIARVTRERTMPPWQPAPGHGVFQGTRRLRDADVDTISRWAASGAPEGDPAAAPKPPAFATGWSLGPPDALIRLSKPFSLAAGGTDQIRTFVVPSGMTEQKHVRAIDFDPGASRAIHHANIKIDATRSSRWLDEQDPGDGYEGAGGRGSRFPDGHFLGWTPGQSPRVTDDSPWRLEPGADIVIELHLTPTGKTEEVRPSLALYFTDRPGRVPPYMIRIGRQDLDIPAGTDNHRVRDEYRLPVDARLLAVQPHAHSLARTVRAQATLPDGAVEPLLFIDHWNPRWQDVYRYEVPVVLPRGSIVSVEFTFDNSVRNPRNPHSPPTRVMFGQSAADEMGDLWLQVEAASADTRKTLDADYTPKMLREDIQGALKVIEASPLDPRAHTDLAFCYAAADRREDAVREFREAVRLKPESAGARFDLAVALVRQRLLDDAWDHLQESIRLKPDLAEAYANLGAVRHLKGDALGAMTWYRKALALKPAHAETEYNLGRAYADVGSPDLAIPHYRAALALVPDDPAALSALGSALASTSQRTQAIAQYRQALDLRPDFVPALVDLAWLLAADSAAQSHREAVVLAERARQIVGATSPTVLDTLAAAYAAEGRAADAVRTAEQALDLAISTKADALAAMIRVRLARYRQVQVQ